MPKNKQSRKADTQIFKNIATELYKPKVSDHTIRIQIEKEDLDILYQSEN